MYEHRRLRRPGTFNATEIKRRGKDPKVCIGVRAWTQDSEQRRVTCSSSTSSFCGEEQHKHWTAVLWPDLCPTSPRWCAPKQVGGASHTQRLCCLQGIGLGRAMSSSHGVCHPALAFSQDRYGSLGRCGAFPLPHSNPLPGSKAPHPRLCSLSPRAKASQHAPRHCPAAAGTGHWCGGLASLMHGGKLRRRLR